MRFLNDIPIKRKLIIITMFTTTLALALACAAFIVYDQVILRRDLVRDLSSTAEMIGFNSASALSFNDPRSAEQTLKSLAAHTHLTGGCVYGRDGAIFATYHRSGEQPQAFPAQPLDEGATFGPETLELLRKINFDGEVIGTIHLRSDFSELRRRMMMSGLIFVVVILGAGLTAYAIVSRLQGVISGPISRLAAVVDQVASESNYSVRVVKHGNDEVGALIDGFNGMLAQIQARDAALQQAHDELEKRVEARTHELAASVSLLNATLDSTTDGIVAVNHAGEVVSFNSKFTAMWNLPPDIVARRNASEIIAFAAGQVCDPKRFSRRVAERCDARETHSVDLVELNDGRTFERYVHPQRVDGCDVGVVVSYRNITERRQAQEQAAREKARLQFIFESVPVGISLRHTRPDGTRTRLINEAHLRICGIDRGQADEPDIFQRISHPEDFARQVPLNRQLDAREIEGFTIDKRYLRPDGATVWATFSIQRHDYSDGSFEELATVIDITALKQAQEHAAREQARFKFIFDSVPVGICLDHVDTTVERNRVLNDAHLRICGLTREEACVGAFQRITHPDDYPQQTVLRQQLEAGLISRFSMEKRYLKSNGETVWVAYSVQRQRYANGSYQDLSTVVDITDVKRAQEEVARERARFKFIFDSVPVGISLVVPEREETHFVNPAHARITGISGADVMDPRAFERATHPDDFVRQRALVHQYKKGEIDQFTLEKRYVHSDGKIVWAALTRRMFIDSSTGTKQSITTIIDITELKAAQEEAVRERARFKFIFEVVPVGISLAAPGEIDSLVVNPAHVAITGVSAADSRLPGVFARASHPDDYRHQLTLTDKIIRGEIDHYSVEKRYLHPDGRIVWAVLTNRTFTDPATGKQQSVTTIIDITERKQAEAKLAETHKQLLDTSRQAGMAEVATGVLHNVGNVLNSVNVSTTLLSDLVRQSRINNVTKLAALLTEQQGNLANFFSTDPRGLKVPGFVQMLSGHLTKEQSDLLTELESLRKSVEHIKEIVAMQQSYAKVSGVSETVTVADLIEDAVRMNSGALARHDVALVRDFQANPNVTLEKHKVLQILVNLMRNAKYACDDAGRNDKQIVVRVSVEGGWVNIAIVDNGIGIPSENLTRIFSHGFTTRKHGHGFGLHSGALAARELGGSLTAESEGPGRGATFILKLPLNQEAKAA